MTNSKGAGCLRTNFWATLKIIFGIIVACAVLLLVLRIIYMKQERRRLIFADDFEDNETNTDIYADTNFQDYKVQVNNILKLRTKVRKINDDQKMHNEYLYGPVSHLTTVIVIHVHTKIIHLKQLLESLKQVAGILRSLLIFAHDYYDEDINHLIEGIDFAKYIQIFYPYNSQLHPHIFPGDDPRYCTGDEHHCEKAKNSKHKRDASLAQKKHSWWWKMNHIFDHLDATKYYQGYIIFIEEDQYVSEDFIYMIKLLSKMVSDYCPDCDMISIGAHKPALSQYHVETGPIVIEEFGTTDFNTGIVFNRTMWDTIKRLRNYFCYYNDYDWVNSLRYLATERTWTTRKIFKMFSSEGPRVFQIGQCSFSDESPNCSVTERMQEIRLFLKLAKRGLYPRSLLIRQTKHKNSTQELLGGWTDARDHELCMFFASKKRFRFNV